MKKALVYIFFGLMGFLLIMLGLFIGGYIGILLIIVGFIVGGGIVSRSKTNGS